MFTDFIEKEILGHRLDVEVSEMSVGVLINQTYYQDISDYLDAASIMSYLPLDEISCSWHFEINEHVTPSDGTSRWFLFVFIFIYLFIYIFAARKTGSGHNHANNEQHCRRSKPTVSVRPNDQDCRWQADVPIP
jgi:hypothetical protein